MKKEIVKVSIGTILKHLIQSMVDDIEMNPDKLEDLIVHGFEGYAHRTVNELVKDYKQYISEDPEVEVEIQLIFEEK